MFSIPSNRSLKCKLQGVGQSVEICWEFSCQGLGGMLWHRLTGRYEVCTPWKSNAYPTCLTRWQDTCNKRWSRWEWSWLLPTRKVSRSKPTFLPLTSVTVWVRRMWQDMQHTWSHCTTDATACKFEPWGPRTDQPLPGPVDCIQCRYVL